MQANDESSGRRSGYAQNNGGSRVVVFNARPLHRAGMDRVRREFRALRPGKA